jgi:hypothetical protein
LREAGFFIAMKGVPGHFASRPFLLIFGKTYTMSTVELKQRLIERIALIEDDNILSEVYRLLEWTNTDPETVKLTPELKAALDAGLDDIENGRTISHEQAKQEIDTWLSK